MNGYGLRVPAIVISPYAKKGYVDHQTLSFDAYLKFIEDDFLSGSRIDPSTDGRPDPRPSVRESASILGDLTKRLRLHPDAQAAMLLPVHPATTLTKTPPFPPRAPSVVAGDAQATVSWVAPITVGGSPITAYHVVPYHGSTVLPATTVTTTTATVKNLTDGQTYTFKVVGTNAIGNIPVSVATQAVTIGAPTVPRSVVAFPGNTTATVRCSAPVSTNGAPITAYRVTPRTGLTVLPSINFPASASGGTVTGLTNGRAYAFTVVALNARGASSSASASTTVGSPSAPTGLTVTVGPTSGHRDGALDIASQHERESRE